MEFRLIGDRLRVQRQLLMALSVGPGVTATLCLSCLAVDPRRLRVVAELIARGWLVESWQGEALSLRLTAAGVGMASELLTLMGLMGAGL